MVSPKLSDKSNEYMPKIAFFITSTGWGGLEMNTLKLIEWFTIRKWQIELFTTKNSKIYEGAVKNGFSIHALDRPKKYFDFKNAKKIASILKQNEIKTICVFDNRDIDVIAIAKRFYYKELKIIYQQHMQIGVNKKDLIHTLRYISIDWWLAPLDWLKDEVIQKTHFPRERIKVIPLGVEIEKFITLKYTKEEARKKLNITTDKTLIGIIGRISPKKGQDLLIHGLLELKQKNVEAEVLIFGSPTIDDPVCQQYFTDIKNFAQANQLDKLVHFREYSEDIQLFYNAIDIFVLASEGETYGMVTIEAMLSGLPVIATKSGGTPEILNFGEFGLLFKPNDVHGFSKCVEWILNTPDAAKIMAVKAQTTAIKKFSHLAEIEQIEKVFMAC